LVGIESDENGTGGILFWFWYNIAVSLFLVRYTSSRIYGPKTVNTFVPFGAVPSSCSSEQLGLALGYYSFKT
jgi:hypothetical protein